MKRLIITNLTSSKGTVRETAELKVKFKPKHSLSNLLVEENLWAPEHIYLEVYLPSIKIRIENY